MQETLLEYRAVREEAGWFDRRDVGFLAIWGTDRFTWLQGMVSNDVRRLEQGTARLPACVLDATGHLLSDLTLIAIGADSPLFPSLPFPPQDFLLAELPRANVDKIAGQFDRFLITEDVEISDVSAEIACLSLQGPRAVAAWQSAVVGVQSPFDELWSASIAVEADHTGSGGFDLYLPQGQAEAARAHLRNAGMPEIGRETQETLRIEAGLPKYGQDMDEGVIALEANLGPTHISLTKGCYVGQEIIARIDSRGHTNRALQGLIVVEGPIPSAGERLTSLPTEADPAPRETGRLTSVTTLSPAVGKPIALGYVRHEHAAPGTHLRIPDTATVLEVAALPFYKVASSQ